MAKFYGPFSISSIPCSPNSGTLFNPNGKTWRSYYGWNINIKNLTFTAPLFNGSGYLTAEANIIQNQNNDGTNNKQGFKFYVDTTNHIRFRYWFWGGWGNDNWYYSSESGNNKRYADTSFKPTLRGITGYKMPLVITKGHTYNFTVNKPSATGFKFTLYDVNTGGTQEYTWTSVAWNNNYKPKDFIVGSKGMSFEELTIKGYPFDSDCLHTMTINGSTWNRTSATMNVPISSNCGWSSTIPFVSSTVHKLNIVIPNIAGLRSAIGSSITWDKAAYNSSTYTWTKYYIEGEELDLPPIYKYFNDTLMEHDTSISRKTTMMIGYSTTNGGTVNYNDFDDYFMGTSDITLYPSIVAFGNSTTDTGPTNYSGGLTSGTIYSTIKPMAATSGTTAGTGLSIWSVSAANSSTWPTVAQNSTNLVTNSTTAGTTYNLKSGVTTSGSYKISSLYKYGDYVKNAHSTVEITIIDLPIPTKNGQLTYNGATQTQAFNNYNTTYMTAQYITGKNVGTYTAIFTLKDTSKARWSDGTITQKTVTWTINKKPLTPTWGTREWVFDGNTHSTTVTLSGIVSGDTCTATLSNNSIVAPGSKTVTITGVSNTNYSIASGTSTTITVTKKPITVSWSNLTKQYDKTVLTPVIDVNGDVAGYEPTITVTPSSSANAGSYTSTATMTDGDDYYTFTTATQAISISPIPVNITWDPVYKVYDGATLTSVPTITNLLPDTTCNMTTSGNTIGPAVGVGIATVTALSNGNYTLTGATGVTQNIMITDEPPLEHGKVYEYDPTKTGEGTAPNNHWIRVI